MRLKVTKRLYQNKKLNLFKKKRFVNNKNNKWRKYVDSICMNLKNQNNSAWVGNQNQKD